MQRLVLPLCLLAGFVLRLWHLGSKGLSYDEAATALMARATPGEIIAFHWRAAFEHPPIWQLLMHVWSGWVGQSEFALRLPSVLAGIVTLSLLWGLARRLHLSTWTASAAMLLATVAPVLVYYSQEARMYALVVAFALGSLVLTQQLTVAPTLGRRLCYLLLNWIMLGLHYYSALLIGAEALFWVVWLIGRRASWRTWQWHGMTLLLTAAPLAAWMFFAPGFRATAASVLRGVGGEQPSALHFLDALWRDLTFAAIRWENAAALSGYVLLPFLILGFLTLLSAAGSCHSNTPARHVYTGQPGILLLLASLVPIVVTLLLSRTLATRYLLYILPPLLLTMAAGITWLGRLHWSIGVVALGVALVPAGLALPHYFGTYEKSAYRDMATYLMAHRQPDEAILLEGPRQHLLAKYYLPAEQTFLTAPIVDLPDYWPINAPPVVPEEMDDYLLQSLREYRGLWLSLTAEDEVDDGEFVPKFLTAVAFQRDCQDWLDVRLCHFVSPHFVQPQVRTELMARFGGELSLQIATVTLFAAQDDEPAYLLATLAWQAEVKPTIDYRVTLRLIDGVGKVLSQRDAFPIGPLLPPSTWNAGDTKPGYLALPIPASIAPGHYQLVVNLYDPATLAPVLHETPTETATDTVLSVAKITINDTIELAER